MPPHAIPAGKRLESTRNRPSSTYSDGISVNHSQRIIASTVTHQRGVMFDRYLFSLVTTGNGEVRPSLGDVHRRIGTRLTYPFTGTPAGSAKLTTVIMVSFPYNPNHLIPSDGGNHPSAAPGFERRLVRRVRPTSLPPCYSLPMSSSTSAGISFIAADN